MRKLTRRSVIAAPAALAAGVALSTPHIARAAATKLTVWWNQGYFPAEDQAFNDIVAEWEKASGNHAEVTYMPDNAIDRKFISALTSNVVPDVIFAEDAPQLIIPENAYNGKFVDVSDVVETQKSAFSATALEAARFFDNTTKKRSYYGVPFESKVINIPVWRTLVDKAGFHASEIPNTWDKYFDFFKPVQDNLRKKGMRHVYGLGLSVSTLGTDSPSNFNQFLLAYGGGGMVTPDGKLHLDDPQVKEAAIKALEGLTTPYKQGYVPQGAINWGGSDNNNAFHSKEVVMTPNYSISIADAVIKDKLEYYYDVITSPMPNDNAGKPVPSLLSVMLATIPKGAKNVEAAKDFLRYFIVPKNLNFFLKASLGRWLPVMPSLVQTDPFWLAPTDPHISVAVRQGVLGPTANWFYVFNPGYGTVNGKQVWGVAEADVIHGMKSEEAVEKAFAQIKKIFAQYPNTSA